MDWCIISTWAVFLPHVASIFPTLNLILLLLLTSYISCIYNMHIHELDRKRNVFLPLPSFFPIFMNLFNQTSLCHSLTSFLPVLSFHEGSRLWLQGLAFQFLHQWEDYNSAAVPYWIQGIANWPFVDNNGAWVWTRTCLWSHIIPSSSCWLYLLPSATKPL